MSDGGGDVPPFPSLANPYDRRVLNLEHAHGQGILRGIARGAGERPQVHYYY